ncbi:MAG: hypothetical protein H0Z33_14825 [Bacillaceae bacterium]|nr:hypothetical protein [Bacillaceae bacterium]
MKIGQVMIQQQFARIGIRQKPAQWQMEVGHARTEHHVSPAKIEMERTDSKLQINADRMRADFHLKPLTDFLRDEGKKAYQKGLGAIQEIAAEGDDFARIELGRSVRQVIADQARADFNETPEFGLGVVPSFNSIQISYQPGTLKMNVDPGGVKVDAEPRYPVSSYQRGSLEVYLKQKHAVQVDTNLRPVDMKV